MPPPPGNLDAGGCGTAWAFGIWLYETSGCPLMVPVVSGNTVSADAVADVLASSGDVYPTPQEGGVSEMEELQAVLAEIYAQTDEVLIDQDTSLLGDPSALCFASEGGGIALGIGIYAEHCKNIQITDNPCVSGSGTADTWVDESLYFPPPQSLEDDVSAMGGGIGFGNGIRAYKCYHSLISCN